MAPNWADRFDYAIPKQELRAKIKALHDDLSTPWTYVRMSRECRQGKIGPKTIEYLVNHNKLTDQYQLILSAFIQDIESGRLRVYYKNPDARRWVMKSGTKATVPLTGAQRLERQKMNKVIVEYYPTAEGAPPPQRRMQVNIGSFGARIAPVAKKQVDLGMPDFASVFKVR